MVSTGSCFLRGLADSREFDESRSLVASLRDEARKCLSFLGDVGACSLHRDSSEW